MAIKLPDPGNGIPEQKTGNDEWTNMKIVRENFADQSNAASRIVGTARGDVLTVGTFGIGVPQGQSPSGDGDGNIGLYTMPNSSSTMGIPAGWIYGLPWTNGETILNKQLFFGSTTADFKIRQRTKVNGEYSKWATFYSDKNTTIGTNKQIVTSSPVVRVFSDKIEAIHEAKDLPLEFTRSGEGDYTLKGTTGLRNGKNDWQIIIPKDDHDNQLIAFTIEDDNGTIHLKTYKRTFSMETFTFGPDLSTPLDIPEGRWVDLHFNDLPQELANEPIE